MTCTRLRDGDATVFICSRVPLRHRKCASCGAPATRQCDAPLRGSKEGKTCDRHLCDGCATRIGPDVDLCPAHARLTRDNPGPRCVLPGEDCLAQLKLPMPPPERTA